MSSHHIVRENQEPALVVVDFQALDTEQLGQLLEWSPMIVTDTLNFDFFLAEGIKVDLVFGEKPSEITQEETAFVPIPLNSTFLHEAMKYLLTKKFTSVNLLSRSALLDLKDYANDLSIVMYSPGIRSAFFKDIFEKWKPKGEKLFLDEGTLKSFQGLQNVGKNVFITTGDGFVTVEFSTADWVLVGEAL